MVRSKQDPHFGCSTTSPLDRRNAAAKRSQLHRGLIPDAVISLSQRRKVAENFTYEVRIAEIDRGLITFKFEKRANCTNRLRQTNHRCHHHREVSWCVSSWETGGR